MKTCLRLFLATAFMLGFTNAYAQVSATGTATLSVVAAITVNNISNLAFTSGAQSEPAETITANAGTTTGSQFDITAEPSTAVNYSIDEAATGIGLEANANDCLGGAVASDTCVRVDTFNLDPVSGTATDGTGALSVYVGATRNALTASQTGGSYSGTFTLTVTY